MDIITLSLVDSNNCSIFCRFTPINEYNNRASKYSVLVKLRKKAKHILTKSKLPGLGYSVNPYVGCQHACVYCYARFMKRFTNHEEPWGTFADVKVNAAALFGEDFKKAKPGEGAFFGSVTDCYQPLEAKYKLTRSILQQISDHPEREFRVSILTKSDLVLRDVDLLKQIPGASVGFSIALTNEKSRRLFEPCGSPISQRIAALQELHEAGIATYCLSRSNPARHHRLADHLFLARKDR